MIMDKFKSILKNIYEILSGIYSGVINTLEPLVGKMSFPLDNFGKVLGSLVGKIKKVMVGTVKTFTKSLKTVFKYMKKISNILLSAVEKMFKIIYKIVIFLLNYVIVPLNYAVKYLTVFFKILQNPKHLIQRLSKIYFSIIDYVNYKYNHYYNIVNEYVKSNFNSYNSLFNTFLKYLLTPNSNSNSNYTYYGRTKFNVITKTIGLFFKKKLRENFMRDNLSFKTANLEPFVYFPLSVDMERNLLINTPFYTNQIETIRIIAKSLPINYRLIVKENPGQELREWRSNSYYKKIQMIPNVTLIHPSIRGRDLVKNASLVISSTGSSALEASFFRTPSIILGDVFYSFLPSVHKITKLEDFPSLIKTALKTKIEMSDLNRFIDITEKTFVEFPAFEFEAEFNSRFYHGLFDVEINEDDLLDFLNKNENIFQDLINTHIEKIQQYYKQKR